MFLRTSWKDAIGAGGLAEIRIWFPKVLTMKFSGLVVMLIVSLLVKSGKNRMAEERNKPSLSAGKGEE